MKRRSFLKLALAGSASLPHGAARNEILTRTAQDDVASDATQLELSEATVADLQVAMQTGARTSYSITESFLRRIALVDKQGPAINAIIELNRDALTIADTLDRERRESGPRGPLHGIPGFPLLSRTTPIRQMGCEPVPVLSRSASPSRCGIRLW